MNELGIIIYQDGEKKSFGRYVPFDNPNYFNTPGHEESFKKEVLYSFDFKMNDLEYDENESFYHNAPLLANQGVILILNNDGGVLAYATSSPTVEQINTVITDDRINAIPEQIVYEFVDDDYQKYDSLKAYANTKANGISSGNKGLSA